MKTIELTEDEIKVLMGMIDTAVRAQGLNVAQNAVHLAGKLQNAPDRPEPENDTEE